MLCNSWWFSIRPLVSFLLSECTRNSVHVRRCSVLIIWWWISILMKFSMTCWPRFKSVQEARLHSEAILSPGVFFRCQRSTCFISRRQYFINTVAWLDLLHHCVSWRPFGDEFIEVSNRTEFKSRYRMWFMQAWIWKTAFKRIPFQELCWCVVGYLMYLNSWAF